MPGSDQIEQLNWDSEDIPTSAFHGDPGDGTSTWFHLQKTVDGGDATQGAQADAAVTDPSSSGSVVALLKGLLSFLRVSAAGVGKAEDTVHSSGDTGVMALGVRRDTAAASSSASGDYEPLQTDATGRLRTSPQRTLSNATSTALEATHVVKASAGVLYGVSGHVDTDGYVLIGDKASALSGSGDAVFAIIKVAEGPFSIEYGLYGRTCSTGISVGFSSAVTFSSGGSNMWVDAQYE